MNVSRTEGNRAAAGRAEAEKRFGPRDIDDEPDDHHKTYYDPANPHGFNDVAPSSSGDQRRFLYRQDANYRREVRRRSF